MIYLVVVRPNNERLRVGPLANYAGQIQRRPFAEEHFGRTYDLRLRVCNGKKTDVTALQNVAEGAELL